MSLPGSWTGARLAAQRGVTVMSGRCGDGASKSGRWPIGAAEVATGAGERGPLGANQAEMSRRTRAPGELKGGETAAKR